jgi:hypothetical protein
MATDLILHRELDERGGSESQVGKLGEALMI